MVGDGLRNDRVFTCVMEGNKQQQFCTTEICSALHTIIKVTKITNNRTWSTKLTEIMILTKTTKKKKC